MSLLDAIRRARRGPWVDPDGEPGPPVELGGRRILLVYLFPNLGDVLLLAPVAKALLDAGAKKVGVVVRAGPARLLKLVDLSLKLHVLPDELALPAVAAGHAEAWADEATANGADAFAETLAAGKYDVAVDLTARADVESRRWVTDIGAQHRLGWIMDDERAEDAGFTWGTPDIRHQTDRHWSRYQILPLRCLGLSEPAFDLDWKLRPTAERKATELYGEGDGPRVLIVPGSRAKKKRWAPDRFADVGGRLVRELGARTVVTGAPDEGPLVRQLVVGIGAATPFTGKDLGTMVALVRAADVVVTNDTAPMHVAFLCERPTVALFTVMSPVCWGPPRADSRFVVLNAPATSAGQNAWARVVHQEAVRLLGRAGPA